MLRPFRPDVWVAERPLRVMGLPIGTRMTVVRLASGDLWVHSPIDVDVPLKAALDELGPVRHVIAPNKRHHLFVEPFLSVYPEATLYGAPGLPEKRPDLLFERVLGDLPEDGWSGEIDQIYVRGHEFRSEVVFLHRASKTLIVTDLVEAIHADASLPLRLAGRIAGMYEHHAPPPDLRRPSDRDLLRASIDRIVAWDFEHVICAHGRPIEADARQVVRDAFKQLLEEQPAPSPTPGSWSPSPA